MQEPFAARVAKSIFPVPPEVHGISLYSLSASNLIGWISYVGDRQSSKFGCLWSWHLETRLHSWGSDGPLQITGIRALSLDTRPKVIDMETETSVWTSATAVSNCTRHAEVTKIWTNACERSSGFECPCQRVEEKKKLVEVVTKIRAASGTRRQCRNETGVACGPACGQRGNCVLPGWIWSSLCHRAVVDGARAGSAGVITVRSAPWYGA